MTDRLPSEAAACLNRLAEDRFGVPAAEISPLAGDASDRTYVRLYHPGGGTPSSVGMILAAPFGDGELPFVNVQAHFSAIGVTVPEIYAADPRAGVLLLEDGGSRSLEDVWSAGGWEAARAYYEESIGIIASLQASPRSREGAIALDYGFDAALFVRELHMTRRYAFEELLGMSAPEADFATPFAALAEELCAMPYALTHRDFHSRNLMTGGPGKDSGRLLVLDFQDARMGPLTYDLASLVYDSYVSLPEENRRALIEKYWQDSDARNRFANRTAFRRALALTALQRNLKAIGTFAYQKTGRGNPRYIRHIPSAAAHARRHLAALSGLENFAARLEPYICAMEEVN
ncbi:MAG: phosphotransferase [Nitrospinota bacterium]